MKKLISVVLVSLGLAVGLSAESFLRSSISSTVAPGNSDIRVVECPDGYTMIEGSQNVITQWYARPGVFYDIVQEGPVGNGYFMVMQNYWWYGLSFAISIQCGL